MKKFIIALTLSLSLSLTLLVSATLSNATPSQNNTYNKALVNVKNVFYEKTTKNYCVSALDVNGEEWILDIVHASTFNKQTLKRLKTCYKGMQLVVEYDNKGTEDIYDDETINFAICED